MSAVAEAPPAPTEVDDDNTGNHHEEEQSGLFLAADYEIGHKVGGRTPDSSVLKLKGKKVELEGQFNRGDRIMAVVTMQVTGDNDQDTIETATGEVKSTSKVQSATLCGITRLEEFIRLKMDGENPEIVADVLNSLGLGAQD